MPATRALHLILQNKGECEMIENATSEWKYSNPPKTGEPILAQWDNNSHPLRVVHWNGFTENWNSNAQGNTKDPWRWARLNTDHVTPECKSDSWLDRVNKVFKELGLSSCTVQEVIEALTLKKENDMDGHKDENKMLNDMCKDLIAENKKLKTENERLHLLAKWITKFPVQDIHDKYNINV